jgi:hypothetical protein
MSGSQIGCGGVGGSLLSTWSTLDLCWLCLPHLEGRAVEPENRRSPLRRRCY